MLYDSFEEATEAVIREMKRFSNDHPLFTFIDPGDMYGFGPAIKIPDIVCLPSYQGRDYHLSFKARLDRQKNKVDLKFRVESSTFKFMDQETIDLAYMGFLESMIMETNHRPKSEE